MSEHAGGAPVGHALAMRLSVPAEGGLRDIAGELATKIAEHLGTPAPDAASLAAAVEGLVERVADGGSQDITCDFRQEARELVIEVRCDGEASEVRHPLPV